MSFTKEILLAPNSAHPGEVYLSGMHRECLVLWFSKNFFVMHVLRVLGEELKWEKRTFHLGVAHQPCPGGGGPWAGVAQPWCISCGPLRFGEELTLPQCSWLA